MWSLTILALFYILTDLPTILHDLLSDLAARHRQSRTLDKHLKEEYLDKLYWYNHSKWHNLLKNLH